MQISVVLPVYNEEGIIQKLFEDYNRESRWPSARDDLEFIFVDDGSTDNTYSKLLELELPNKRIIRTEHLGLSHALYTGILAASGEIIITMDADGQFSFEDIDRLVDALIKDNVDIVAGYRIKRNDSIVRRISSKLSNSIKRLLLGDKVIDSACTLRCFRREARDKILYRFDGFHRFISSFAIINGLRLIEIPVRHRDRAGGEAKFGIINRLPDVIVDLPGACWLKYKRFSADADVRRLSFYPDIIFFVLFISVSIGIFSGYFRVVDDFWLYGSLNRFIGYDYSRSYGWEDFIFNEIVPPLIRIIYALLLNIGELLNVSYPLEWSSKVIGISVLLISYILFARYFSLFFKAHLSKWLSLSIIFYGLMSSEIYSGLARSFTYILIPILLLSLKKNSLFMQSLLLLSTALIYPVVVPLFIVTILVYSIISRPREIYRAALPILSAFIGLVPMLIKIDITAFSPPSEGDLFLKKTYAFDLPLSSDLSLLAGFLGSRNIVEWINFNMFHQWSLNPHLIDIIGIFLIVLLGLAMIRRFVRKASSAIDIAVFVIFVIFLILSLLKKGYVEISYIFKWGLAGLSLFWAAGICSARELGRFSTILSLGLSSGIAFLLTHILSSYLGFGVHEPGRQMQRAFAIIIPVLSSSAIYNLISITKKRGIVYLSLLFIAFMFYPQVKLVSPHDRYIIQRIAGLPGGSIVLSHPLTANWIVSHTDKSSTIIDEQIRVTKRNPIRGSREIVMPTEMAYNILSIYYSRDNRNAKAWCSENPDGYILVEDFYYSEEFFRSRREPYLSFVERHNPEHNFALLRTDLNLRHYITPESFLIICSELKGD